jgi:tetratricopeptide (TPR) repeat protein
MQMLSVTVIFIGLVFSVATVRSDDRPSHSPEWLMSPKSIHNEWWEAFRAEQYQNAIDIIGKAINQEPKDCKLYFARALTYSCINSHRDAVDDLSRAIELDNRIPPLFGFRASELSRQNRWRQAIEDYGKAIHLAPDEAGYYLRRGYAFGAVDKYDSALSDYSKAIELGDESVRVYENRAWVYNRLAQPERALADYDRALRQDTRNAQLYAGRALAYQYLGKFQSAIVDLDKAIDLDKSDSLKYANRASTLLRLERYEEAMEDCRKVIALTPHHTEALHGLARLYATCPKKSVRDGKKAVELATQVCRGTEWKNAAHLDTLAAAFAEDGQFAAAIRIATDALKYADPGLQGRIMKRIALYESNTAYQEVGGNDE